MVPYTRCGDPHCIIGRALEIDKIRARAAASKAGMSTPAKRTHRDKNRYSASKAPRRQPGGNDLPVTGYPSLYPGWDGSGAGRCSWARTESCRSLQ
jgi:hypothetical protein